MPIDLTPLVEGATLGIIAIALSFVISEIVGFFITRSSHNAIVQSGTIAIGAVQQSASVAINAMVSMTGVSVVATQAEEITETHELTPILTPK